ncbi:hypothetical protein V3C99_006619, partial [Haemonchus contortus]|uniref:Envelope glycoprotein n=1 Tax=Haemonchus contortus TaxID=6289 RepID=A0A7I4YQM2_HAECO
GNPNSCPEHGRTSTGSLQTIAFEPPSK